MKHFDAKRPEFSPYGFTCDSWTPTRMPRPDRHNEIEINLLLSGSITYLLGGRRMTLTARKLGVFWAATPHQIVDFEGDATYFVATLPLSEFLRAGIERTVANKYDLSRACKKLCVIASSVTGRMPQGLS